MVTYGSKKISTFACVTKQGFILSQPFHRVNASSRTRFSPQNNFEQIAKIADELDIKFSGH